MFICTTEHAYYYGKGETMSEAYRNFDDQAGGYSVEECLLYEVSEPIKAVMQVVKKEDTDV